MTPNIIPSIFESKGSAFVAVCSLVFSLAYSSPRFPKQPFKQQLFSFRMPSKEGEAPPPPPAPAADKPKPEKAVKKDEKKTAPKQEKPKPEAKKAAK